MNITTKDFAAVFLRMVTKQTKKAANHHITKITTGIFDKAVERTPVRTGYLKSKWEMHFEERDGLLTGVIQNSAHYAKYVEYGTYAFSGRYMLTTAVNDIKFSYGVLTL